MNNATANAEFSHFWPGDTGELDIPTRRVLARLISGPYIDADEQGALWATLQDHVGIIESRLNDLFLELAMDVDSGYAFARNVESTDTLKIPKVMRTQTLNHVTSMLLMRVRQLHLQAASQQEIAYTDEAEIRDFLEPYIAAEGIQDSSKVQRRVNSAISTLRDYSILKDQGDRMRISGIVALIVTPELMDHYLAQYREFISGTRTQTGEDAENPEASGDLEELSDSMVEEE